MIEKKYPKDAIIIDVRTPEEYKQERVRGALHIDFFSAHFIKEIQKLDQGKTYLLYCRSGNRSAQAQQIMGKLGFLNVENIGGLVEARDIFGTES